MSISGFYALIINGIGWKTVNIKNCFLQNGFNRLPSKVRIVEPHWKVAPKHAISCRLQQFCVEMLDLQGN